MFLLHPAPSQTASRAQRIAAAAAALLAAVATIGAIDATARYASGRAMAEAQSRIAAESGCSSAAGGPPLRAS